MPNFVCRWVTSTAELVTAPILKLKLAGQRELLIPQLGNYKEVTNSMLATILACCVEVVCHVVAEWC